MKRMVGFDFPFSFVQSTIFRMNWNCEIGSKWMSRMAETVVCVAHGFIHYLDALSWKKNGKIKEFGL